MCVGQPFCRSLWNRIELITPCFAGFVVCKEQCFKMHSHPKIQQSWPSYVPSGTTICQELCWGLFPVGRISDRGKASHIVKISDCNENPIIFAISSLTTRWTWPNRRFCSAAKDRQGGSFFFLWSFCLVHVQQTSGYIFSFKFKFQMQFNFKFQVRHNQHPGPRNC